MMTAGFQVKPNLHMQSSVELKGRIADKIGAAFKNSRVELRRYVSENKQKTIAKVTIDAEGNFQFRDGGEG